MVTVILEFCDKLKIYKHLTIMSGKNFFFKVEFDKGIIYLFREFVKTHISTIYLTMQLIWADDIMKKKKSLY